MTQDFGRLGIGPKQSLFDVFANPPKAGEALRIVINAMAQDFGRLGIGPKQSFSEIFSYYEITSSPPSGAPRDDGVGFTADD